jgi:ribosomal protein L28
VQRGKEKKTSSGEKGYPSKRTKKTLTPSTQKHRLLVYDSNVVKTITVSAYAREREKEREQ